MASRAYLRGVFPPNEMELMDRYVEGMAKVFGQVRMLTNTSR